MPTSGVPNLVLHDPIPLPLPVNHCLSPTSPS